MQRPQILVPTDISTFLRGVRAVGPTFLRRRNLRLRTLEMRRPGHQPFNVIILQEFEAFGEGLGDLVHIDPVVVL